MLGAAGFLLVASAATSCVPAVLPAVLLLDAAFVLLAVVDAAHTPRPERLALWRELPDTVGLSRPFERVLVVDGRSARFSGRVVELHEEFPDCFVVLRRATTAGDAPAVPGDPSGGGDVVRLDGDGRARARRVYRSERRGTHRLGDVRLAVRGPLGLVVRQARWAGGQEVVALSALTGLRSTLALAASERWRDLGVRRIRRRGGQTEFESLRDYVRGDDVRLVDWKAFARRGKPTVREYQEERGQELVIAFDCGRRMRATAPGTAGAEGPAGEGGERPVHWSKLDWALDAGLQLAAVALQHGDRVGCLVYDDRVRAWVPPGRSRQQFARLCDAVCRFEPSRRDADLSRALRELGVRHRRRATVVILSDVADPLSVDLERRALSTASRRHKLVFAGLDDPEVRRALEAPEAEGPLPPSVMRAAALGAVETRRRSLRRLAGGGARVLDALPAEAAGPLIAAWLDARRGA